MARSDRRRFLKLAGTAATGSLAALAGCSGDGGSGDGGDGSDGSDGDGGTSTGDGGSGGSSDPIKIGLLEPLSGPIAASGKEAEMGTKIMVEQINANGGLGGRQVEVVTADTKASPDTGVKRARQLIQQENCEIIVGLVSSAVTKAVNQFTASQGVPLFVTGAATPDIVQQECKKTTFRINSNLIHQQRATAQMMLELGGETKVAAVEPDYVFGQQSWEVFEEYYGSLVDGLNVVSEQFPAFLKGDYAKEIQATLDAEPNVVHSSLYSGDMVSFIQQAKQYDFFDKIDYFVAGVVPQEVAAALGSDMPDNCYAFWPDYFAYPEDNTELQEFTQTYMDRFGELPTTFSIATGSAWQIMAKAAEQAGTEDVDAFINAVEGIRLDGIQNMDVRAADHQGVPDSYITGKMSPIGQEYADLYGHEQLYGLDSNEQFPIGRDTFAIGPTNCDL